MVQVSRCTCKPDLADAGEGLATIYLGGEVLHVAVAVAFPSPSGSILIGVAHSLSALLPREKCTANGKFYFSGGGGGGAGGGACGPFQGHLKRCAGCMCSVMTPLPVAIPQGKSLMSCKLPPP